MASTGCLMSTENLKFPLIHQHNAQYPREIYAAREVSRLLQKVGFPGGDVWLDLRFDYALSEHSSSKLDVMLVRGEPHGTVDLCLHGLFLAQDFPAMVREVIPHELAHILDGLSARSNETEVQKPHGESWERIFERLTDGDPDIEPLPKVRANFDGRAVRLSKNGILAQCECGDDDSFEVFPRTNANTAKLQGEELKCSTCKYPYVLYTGAVPECISKSLKFLESIQCEKLQHTHLQR